MFIGEYNHSIDEKGRLAVPVKFRSALSDGAVVTRGLDSCLFLYTMEEWAKIADRISSLPFNQANARAFSRHMLAGAMDVSLDKQGRIIVPDYLRKGVGISKKVVIVGLHNRLEIWDEATWKEYLSRTGEESGEIAEQLGSI